MGRVTDDPTPPARRRGVRTAAARAIDDAQLARPRLALTMLVLLCAMILGGSLLPVPYVIERPGPAIDVLGEWEDEEILVIDGAETHPTDGSLMMTTVSVDGGPGYRVAPVEVVAAWFDRSKMVLPREAVFPDGQTREQTTLTNTAAMSTSQQDAVAVALDELDIEYRDVVMIAGVQEDGAAAGTLEGGDVIVSVGGQTAGDVQGYRDLIAAVPHGEDVEMTVRRDGEEKDLQVPTELVDGTPRMGVVLAEGHEFPLDIDIAVGDVGGPSAGLIFSLSVYDELTEGALTGGHAIAGTGTIAEDGTVGSIGGIRQKMVGAEESDAQFFLAPSANCEEVVGYEPDGLEVVAVGTFEEALEATTTIAETGAVEGLPTCEDVTP
ncbi:YlbL family protein [Brachybacterium paraconglomeratum]|uniref:YlbL family protein n=1 Tax=Brachybacterium paraconglomeratum TaxID=173362 RepID=UPI0021A2B724|nr:PDZ domain-containing protein [Brachybacterium paraconglomeratum]MCT1908237.1 PDZ domain-containing protein [Brachybacterium paraconglomeratum]